MFDRYAEKLSHVKTSMELIKILDDLSLSAGFTQYRLGLMMPTQHLGRPHLLIFSNCNPDWVENYRINKLASKDPILYLAMQQNSPITWNSIEQYNGLPIGAQEVMGKAKDFGLVDGISFPLRGPRSEFGVLSFITDKNDTCIDRHKAQLFLMANMILDAALRVAYGKREKTSLTGREIECLFWCSEGKTSADTAAILGLAEATVNFHLTKAIKKLGATNKYNAIMAAGMAGLLQPQLKDAEIEDEVSPNAS
ncbi:helix-turn-helix transcriptional regulator [Aeromonas veronii]|uniref:LuxR family transcriptional regulator n=1 Tax=Aeromonas veronii TaxID=654 RepID=A0A4S5CGK9_AERVE|nr:LuxR family transcriptional regulator [Aeromonas veronii]THJ43601.1 LuxR family transcriptional regulator [Aeromonas veronii]